MSLATEATAAAHEEMGAIIQMGAAVASIRYDNFALDIFFESVMHILVTNDSYPIC